MPALSITDDQIDAEATRRGLDVPTITPEQRRQIKHDLATEQLGRYRPSVPKPDHLTVVVQVLHGERVLSTSEQRIPLTP